jgi:glycine cleavage system H protein
MHFPEDLRYSAEHEWVRANGTRAEVGITDFAQDSLGDIVFVELPEVGATLALHAAASVIDSTKSTSDIYAPVSGVVVEVNDALTNAPEAVNRDPYGTGWIFRVEMSDPAELDALMDATAYQALVT